MTSVRNVLCALTDFLNEAQRLGVIKEFTVIQCEAKSEEEFPGLDKLLSKFLDKIDGASIFTKSTSCLVAEHINVTEEDKNCENSNVIESSDKRNLVQVQADTTEVPLKIENPVVESPIKRDLVQIQVDINEMKRRISAFITRKRKEVDEWNVQEFCGRSYIDEQDPAWEQSDSCARVDAVFVPRRGCKSHIKVSRVKNVWGPQTHLQPEAKKIKQEPCEIGSQANDACLLAVEERLLNMETYLKLKSDNSLRSNIFQRLKDLENRILLLESTSPEYIHLPSSDYSSPKKKSSIDKEKVYSNCSTDEIQKRIQSLKESLKMKSPQIKSEQIF